MTPQKKAAWIRNIFLLVVFGLAAAGAAYFVMPKEKPGEKERPNTATKVTKENIKEFQGKPGVLTITNLRLDGNKNSKKLEQLLEQLKQNKYHDKVQIGEVDLEKEVELATEAGLVDLKQFAGALDFHSEGKKLGELVGETDPKVVEETIDRFLAGMLQRFGKDWLPEVPGMQRAPKKSGAEVRPAAPAAG